VTRSRPSSFEQPEIKAAIKRQQPVDADPRSASSPLLIARIPEEDETATKHSPLSVSAQESDTKLQSQSQSQPPLPFSPRPSPRANSNASHTPQIHTRSRSNSRTIIQTDSLDASDIMRAACEFRARSTSQEFGVVSPRTNAVSEHPSMEMLLKNSLVHRRNTMTDDGDDDSGGF
jgi:hypothetical protein